jgi:hypothetical protein
MSNQHRATPEQWANMKEYQDDGLDDGYGSCIIELRARIEALEAAQLEAPMTELRAASAEARPAGLVEQVSKRIEFGIDANQDPEGVTRAVIREVVSALRNHAKSPHIRVMTFEAAADWLELEADRG